MSTSKTEQTSRRQYPTTWETWNLSTGLETGLAAAALVGSACGSGYCLCPEKLKVRIWGFFEALCSSDFLVQYQSLLSSRNSNCYNDHEQNLLWTCSEHEQGLCYVPVFFTVVNVKYGKLCTSPMSGMRSVPKWWMRGLGEFGVYTGPSFQWSIKGLLHHWPLCGV